MTTPGSEPRQGIDLSWLLTLRWGALAGQAATILAVDRVLGIDLPLLPLALVLAVGVASNLALASWRPAALDRMLAGVMFLDVGLLTAVLYFTGGPFNPFSFLYLVNIALSAVILPPGWTWALVGCSLILFGGLFFAHVPLPIDHVMGHDHPISLHIQGMWVAFGVAAFFIVYFIQRVRGALAERDAELGAARSAAARHEKLASLATLAAGAAHELATPLSTIAVVAKELERALGAAAGATSTIEDVQLIREQVERCRGILVQMAADAGESTGEALAAVPLVTLLEGALADLAGRARVAIAFDPAASASAAVHGPPRALAQSLRGIVKNALEAGTGEVRVGLERGAGTWRLAVEDRGAGMTPEVLARAGEPFFTTKNGEGLTRGMGLGLFLARVVLERLGGGLELDSAAGRGTTVTLVVPASAAATDGRREGSGAAAMLDPVARRAAS